MTEEHTHPLSNGRRPFYQRQLIVDRRFQLRLLGTLLAVWAANVVFFVLVQHFLYLGHLNAFYEVVPRDDMTPLMSFGSLITASILFVAIFGANVLAMVTIYLSNQIAGPLFRTRSTLQRVADGDWNVELRFRQNDFLQEFPGAFNSMVASLRKSAEGDLQEIELLEAAAGEHEEIRESVARLRARVQQRLQVEEPSATAELDAPQEAMPIVAG